MRLTTITIKNIGIVISLHLFNFGLAAVAQIILAQVLLEKDFGIAGIASACIGFLGAFIIELGFGTAVICRKTDVKKALYTSFILQLIFSCVLFSISFCTAPLWAMAFKEPLLTDAIRIFSVIFFINLIGFTPTVYLHKQLKFIKFVIPSVCGTVVSFIFSVSLAYSGFGYWSIIVGTLTGTLTKFSILGLLVGWKLKFQFDMKIAKELYEYSKFLIVYIFVGLIGVHVSNVIVGKIVGVELFGCYTVALYWGTLIASKILSFVQPVILPSFVIISDDRSRIKNAYFKTIRYGSLFIFPTCMGLFILAPEFLIIVLGKGTDKWVPAILPLQVICIAGLISSLQISSTNIFLVYRKTSFLAILSIGGSACLLFTTSIITSYLSITGAAIALLINTCIFVPISLILAAKLLGFRIVDCIKILALPFVASSGMTMGIFLLKFIYPITYLYTIVIYIIIGCIIYIGLIYILTKGKILKDIRKMIKMDVSKK